MFLLLLPVFITGCVGILPFPSQEPVYGEVLKKQDTEFIRVGRTSASEIFANLGTNCISNPRHRVVAFSWEKPGGKSVWWLAMQGGGVAGELEWSRWRAYFVAFDTSDVVIAAEKRRLSSRKSLDEQLEAWAIKHHAATNHIHPETFLSKDP